MKAVILAGGEGSRLRPLSLDRPKPMTPLFGRPVLAHILDLLRRCGVTDVAMTLRYQPQAITGHFGDGSEFGCSITYFTEDEPLGTAGGVKACARWLDKEDFLVLSGDCVCDFDLTEAVAFHREHQAQATLLLHRESDPLEYGLVMTGEDGRVQRFLEKPGWAQVFTDQANTGIYVLSPSVLDLIPGGVPWDFSRDLFPRMLAEGRPLFGFTPRGYWCDMGDCRAYLRCLSDALDGKVQLDLGLRQSAPGVWSAAPVPASAVIVPPCWIGPGAVIGEGAVVGAHTVLEAGSTVEAKALVQRSALLGASAGPHAALYGSILCTGASAGRSSVLNEGAVLGEGAAVGRDAVLREGVKVWPGLRVAEGARLNASLTSGSGTGRVCFSDGGVIRGALELDLTPETLLTIGAILGTEGKVGVGHGGGEGARMLAQAAASGITSAGGQALCHDAPFPAAGSWLAGHFALPVSLFVEQKEDRIFLHFFDRLGLPLGRGRERRLESTLLRHEIRRVPSSRVGTRDWISGVTAAYSGAAAQQAGQRLAVPLTVAVPGSGPEEEALAAALAQLGCTVLRRQQPGAPAFFPSRGGTVLAAADEEERPLPPQRLLALLCLVELEEGSRSVALPAEAPEAAEQLVISRDAIALRLGRDGADARARYSEQPALRDAVFAACRLCARMGRSGESLLALDRRLPDFAIQRQEVPLRGDRGALMQALSRRFRDAEALEDGLRIRTERGWVRLSPLSRRASLRVAAECADLEAARELCGEFCRTAEQLDRSSAPECGTGR